MATTALAAVPVLADDELYLGDNGRIMCIACAGSTAKFTGHDLSGAPVSRVTEIDVAEWAAYDLGPMSCTCGRVTR